MKFGENSKCFDGKMRQGLWPSRFWQPVNVNDALKKRCARRLINQSQPSLIIHDRRGKGKKRKRGKRRSEHSVTRYSVKHKTYYN